MMWMEVPGSGNRGRISAADCFRIAARSSRRTWVRVSATAGGFSPVSSVGLTATGANLSAAVWSNIGLAGVLPCVIDGAAVAVPPFHADAFARGRWRLGNGRDVGRGDGDGVAAPLAPPVAEGREH